ncbi:MAG: hypothetical protein Q7J35_02165 [Candidatus Methanoperedens sp.]|nr:hypothetical protein [Candidatus Methanoperedens sp.]
MFHSITDKHQKDVAWGSEVTQEQLIPKMPEGIIMLALKINKVLPDPASGVIERREIWRKKK